MARTKFKKGQYERTQKTGRRNKTYKGKPVMTLEERRAKQIKASLKLKRKNRKACLEFYGGTPPKCACCGETIYEFLAIDHINGGGNKHRREIGVNIYGWLVKNSFPGGFQVLCHNCNLAKGFYGICPHEKNNL